VAVFFTLAGLISLLGSDTVSKVYGYSTAPTAHGNRRANVLAIVIHRQEVRPMNSVSVVGAPLQATIARLR
jgi:hypothetical protein